MVKKQTKKKLRVRNPPPEHFKRLGTGQIVNFHDRIRQKYLALEKRVSTLRTVKLQPKLK
jgi:hypothetical protein